MPTYVINAFAAHYSSATLYLCNARTNHQNESGTLPLVLAPRNGHIYSNIFKGYEDDGVPAAQLVTFDQGGHLVIVKDAVWDAVRRFLAENG